MAEWLRMGSQSQTLGEEAIKAAAGEALKKEADRKAKERQKKTRELLGLYTQLGMKKLDDQGITVYVQWDEGNWSTIPYDQKKQILASIQAMKGGTAVIHINGYYSGSVLAESGIFSDTIN